jgi:two-component system OmpR family sensor kinase
MSLRGRLVTAVCVVALLSLGSAGVVTFTLFSKSQLRQVDDSLQRTHEPLESLVSSEGGTGVAPAAVDDDDGGGNDGLEGPLDADNDLERSIAQLAPGVLVVVLDPTGEIVVSLPAREPGHGALTIDVEDLTLPPEASGDRDRPSYSTMTAEDDSTRMRLRTSRLSDGSVLVMGLSLREVSASERRLVTIELIVAGAALLAAAILGWLLVRLGLRPLRDVERTALVIASGGDLEHEVPGGDRPTEVGRLAAALNTMLGRIRAAFTERDAKERALQESEARMRRFVADVSHELRTPLAAVVAYAELFERGARDHPADLERALRGISTEAGRMGELVEELLLLARLDEGRPLQMQTIDLVGVVIDAITAARTVSADWPISLHVEDVVEVDGDPSRLRQVVDNLLANVRTHTPAGTTTTVRVGWRDGQAALSIADDGPGMTPEESARVFERFFRADPSRSRESGGAGLGMAIVDAIVTAHHGHIELDTAPSHGVHITVLLPRHHEQENG